MADASIMIVTRNRKEKARKAIQSAIEQSVAADIIVIDDASEDATCAELSLEFPVVRFERSDIQKGLIVQRNRAVELSRAAVVVSLDDDAIFADRDTVRETLRLFEEPRVGAAAIPFTNISDDGRQERMLPPIDDDGKIRVSNTFIGTAFAVRRAVFEKIGGLQGRLFHWGEESEFSQRLLAAGCVVAIGSRGMIHHFPNAPGKYSRRVNRFIYRNALLSLWLNAPLRYLLTLLPAQLAKFMIEGIRKPAKLMTILEGTGLAIREILFGRKSRRPIGVNVYRLWLKIRRERPVILDSLREDLAKIQPIADF